MKTTLALAMIVAAVAAVPAMGGGARTPGNSVRSATVLRTPAPWPATPMSSGRGRTIALDESYAILDTTSIFQADRGLKKVADPPPTPERALPVFRAAMFDEGGPLALMEIPSGRGGTRVEYLREGQTFAWDGSRVLSITPDLLILAPTASAGDAAGLEVVIGCDLKGKQIGSLPLAPPYVPNNPTTARTPRTGTSRFGRGLGMTGVTPAGFFGNETTWSTGNADAVTGITGEPLTPPPPSESSVTAAPRLTFGRQNRPSVPMGPTSRPTTPNMR
jgi:hypothetical protein